LPVVAADVQKDVASAAQQKIAGAEKAEVSEQMITMEIQPIESVWGSSK
jgi:hypothetical protein